MKKVTKAIFPVAGMGTRFPARQRRAEEMLPIVDKALDPVRSGRGGRRRHHRHDLHHRSHQTLDRGPLRQGLRLETELRRRGKKQLLEIVRQTVPKGVNCIYIRQSEGARPRPCRALRQPRGERRGLRGDPRRRPVDNKDGTPVLKQMVDGTTITAARCSAR